LIESTKGKLFDGLLAGRPDMGFSSTSDPLFARS